MSTRDKIIVGILIFLVYVGSYVWYRNTNIEISQSDHKEYVIFPDSNGVYHSFRPLVYIDAAITGMRFHIGSH